MSAQLRAVGEQQAATRAAARLLSARTTVCVALGVLCLVVSTFLVFAPLPVPGAVVSSVILALAIATGCVIWRLCPRQDDVDPTGQAVTVVDEPNLYQWMIRVTNQLGVEPVGSIRLAPSTGIRVDDLPGTPHLVIGVGWLTWLTETELSRMAALELSMLRTRTDPTIRSALHLATALDLDSWRASRNRLVGKPIRWVGERLHERREELYDACLAWAADEIPVSLEPTSAELGEARLADEGWQVLASRWIRPAARAGRALDALALACRDLLTGCEQQGLLERSWERDESQPAVDLLRVPAAADAAVCKWAALEAAHEEPLVLVGWDQYVDQVSLRNWRESLRTGVAAATHMKGSAQSMSIGSLISAAEAGVSEFADLVSYDRQSFGDDGDDLADALQAEAALVATFADAISLGLVEQGLASPKIDVLWGIRLAADEDEFVDVESLVRACVRAGDWTGLTYYLEELGIDVDRPLWAGGAAGGLAVDADSTVLAWRRGRVYDVLLVDGFLRAYRYGLWRQVKLLLRRFTGEADDLEMASRLEEVDDHAKGPPQPALAISLADVQSARLFRRPHGLTWTIRLKLPDSTLRFSGSGSGSRIAPVLQRALHDRLEVTGLGARPSPFLRTLGKLGWYVIWGGVLVLLVGAVGYLMGAGSSAASDTGMALDAITVFGVLGLALITIGMVPYMFIARRGHRPA